MLPLPAKIKLLSTPQMGSKAIIIELTVLQILRFFYELQSALGFCSGTQEHWSYKSSIPLTSSYS